MRELREELGWVPPVPPELSPADFFTLFASFPNVYPYKGIVYNTCDIYFTFSAPGLSEKDLCLEEGEVAGIRFARPEEIDPADLAFDSTRRAFEAFREFKKRRAV